MTRLRNISSTSPHVSYIAPFSRPSHAIPLIKPKISWQTVKPLELLFGRFGYLVANNIKTSMKPLTYRLDLIEEVEDAGQFFEAPKGFN